MEQKSLSAWCQAAVGGLGAAALIVYLWVIPSAGQSVAYAYPEFAWCYLPWLIFLSLTALPIAAILVLCFFVVRSIGRDRSFSRENSRRMTGISFLAAGTTVYFWAGNLAFLLLGMSHPGIFLLAHFFVLLGIAVSVAAAALSHLVYKAALMKEEEDLTV